MDIDTALRWVNIARQFTAQFNPEFGQRFAKLLKDHRLTPSSAEIHTQFSARHSTFRLWSAGQVPTDLEKFAKVLSFFPEENLDNWLDLMLRKSAA